MKSERCPTCGRRHKRSNPQNAMYWLLLHTAAAKLKPGGKVYPAASYHAMFKEKFLGAEEIRLPNGKTQTVVRSSADLDALEFSDFFGKVEADLAEHGIWLADHEER